ncbi:MAG: phage antirepressor [Flavobacteriaceae bacterium]|nr:MAG: phage antirepressor [Flavobacteriaceae bacterium]
MNQIINHAQFGQIEVEVIKGEPWFVAKDICDVLGLENVTKAMYGLDDDEKLTLPKVRAGQKREMNLVSESGLYALIIRSNKPIARKFRKWVTSEVLPSIRKYGTYSTDEKVMDRAMKRAEAKKVKESLQFVSENLSATDKRLIAKQCLTEK